MDEELRKFIVEGMARRGNEIVAIHAYLLVAGEREHVFEDSQLQWHQNRSEELQEELETMQRGIRSLFPDVADEIISEAMEQSSWIP